MSDVPIEEVILQRCKPFLEKFKESYTNGVRKTLRRGMLIQPEDTFTRIKAKKDRTPVNTKKVIHELVDDWFNDKFGIRARSQAFFCTSDTYQAQEYGFPFLVFPEGKFQIIHSDKVKDLFIQLTPGKLYHVYEKMNNIQKDVEYNDAVSLINNLSQDELRPVVYKAMESFNYRMNDFEGALMSKNEIMVYCDYYYVAQHNSEEALQLLMDYVSDD